MSLHFTEKQAMLIVWRSLSYVTCIFVYGCGGSSAATARTVAQERNPRNERGGNQLSEPQKPTDQHDGKSPLVSGPSLIVRRNAVLEHIGAYRVGSPVTVRLVLRNDEATPVSVLNPDMGRPQADGSWEYSDDAYRVAIMLSFSFIEVTLRDESGHPVLRTGAATLATPILGPRILLKPGQSLTLDFDLSEFYELKIPGKYDLIVEYGDEQSRFHANTQIAVDP